MSARKRLMPRVRLPQWHEGAVVGVIVNLVVGDTVTYVTERGKARDERGIPPHREGYHEVFQVGGCIETGFISFGEKGQAAAHREIGHKGKGVPCRYGCRVGGVYKTLVPGCYANSAHSAVPGRAAVMQVSYAVNRIR